MPLRQQEKWTGNFDNASVATPNSFSDVQISNVWFVYCYDGRMIANHEQATLWPISALYTGILWGY